MEIDLDNKLKDYMDILYRLTKIEHWLMVEGNISKVKRGTKAYRQIEELYNKLLELQIELEDHGLLVPRWNNHKEMGDF